MCFSHPSLCEPRACRRESLLEIAESFQSTGCEHLLLVLGERCVMSSGRKPCNSFMFGWRQEMGFCRKCDGMVNDTLRR